MFDILEPLLYSPGMDFERPIFGVPGQLLPDLPAVQIDARMDWLRVCRDTELRPYIDPLSRMGPDGRIPCQCPMKPALCAHRASEIIFYCP